MTRPYTDVATVRVEIGTGATRTPGGYVTWGTARWGTGVWSGYEPLWREIDCDRVISANNSRGRDRSWEPYGVGTLGVEVTNEDGAYSWNPAAVDPDENPIRPGDPIRFGVVVAGAFYPLARGYIEAIDEGYEGLEIVTASLVAQDALGQLNRGQIVPLAPQGANERTDARIERILDRAQWPTAWRAIDPGLVPLQATTFDETFGALATMAAESDGGTLHADMANRLVFHNRTYEYRAQTSPVLSFGDTGAEDICPLAYEVARDVDDIANQVIYQAVGGQPQVASDVDSMARYGMRAVERSDLINANDSDVRTLALNELHRRSQAPVVVRALTFHVFANHPVVKVANLRLGDLVHVAYRHPREGWTWAKDLHVQSIAHTITADAWEVRLGVDDLAAYLSGLDSWGTGIWGTSKWS